MWWMPLESRPNHPSLVHFHMSVSSQYTRAVLYIHISKCYLHAEWYMLCNCGNNYHTWRVKIDSSVVHNKTRSRVEQQCDSCVHGWVGGRGCVCVGGVWLGVQYSQNNRVRAVITGTRVDVRGGESTSPTPVLRRTFAANGRRTS